MHTYVFFRGFLGWWGVGGSNSHLIFVNDVDKLALLDELFQFLGALGALHVAASGVTASQKQSNELQRRLAHLLRGHSVCMRQTSG